MEQIPSNIILCHFLQINSKDGYLTKLGYHRKVLTYRTCTYFRGGQIFAIFANEFIFAIYVAHQKPCSGLSLVKNVGYMIQISCMWE